MKYSCKVEKTGEPATQEELQKIAWYIANAGGETHEVAELRPNPWGL